LRADFAEGAIGVRMTELPITPQKILKALEEKQSSGDS